MSWSLWWFLTRAEKQHKISLLGNYHFLVWIEPSKGVKNTFQTIQSINDYSKFIKLMKLTITKENIFFLHPNNTSEKSWRKLNQNSTTDMWNPDNIEIRLHPCSKRRQGRILYTKYTSIYVLTKITSLLQKKKNTKTCCNMVFETTIFFHLKKRGPRNEEIYIWIYMYRPLCIN